MNSEGKWIRFVEGPPKAKTNTFDVVNHRSGGVIGRVEWYGPWRQYCFFPGQDMVFSDGCLREIAAFCEWARRQTHE